jgi:hypothetical protein
MFFLLSTLWNLAHLPVEIFNTHVNLSYMCLCKYVIGLYLRLLRDDDITNQGWCE